MNRILGLQLTVYSLLLLGLSILAYSLNSAMARPTLLAGCVGGALCLVWAARAIQGRPGKAPSLLTLTPTTFVLLSQAVLAWTSRQPESTARAATAGVITVLAIFSFAMLLRIAYAGAFTAPETQAPNATSKRESRLTGSTASSLQAGHGA